MLYRNTKYFNVFVKYLIFTLCSHYDYVKHSYRKVGFKFSARKTFLEKPTSGMLKTYIRYAQNLHQVRSKPTSGTLKTDVLFQNHNNCHDHEHFFLKLY